MGYGLVPRVGASGGSFMDKSREHMSNAIGARSAIRPGQKTTTTAPGKTAGGALGASAGMAVAGAQFGSIVPGIGTTVGAIGGAVVGLASYYLS